MWTRMSSLFRKPGPDAQHELFKDQKPSHASSYFPFNSIVPSTFHGSWIYWAISMLDSLAQPSSEILVNILASRNMLAKAGEGDRVIKTKMVRGFFFLSSSIDSHMYLSCLSQSTYLLANTKAERHKEDDAQVPSTRVKKGTMSGSLLLSVARAQLASVPCVPCHCIYIDNLG